MTVAKRFRWEAAHRLPWHEGDCKHLHGHSYRMMVELTGEPDARGMLIDFKHVKRLLRPLVNRFDHATLVAASDDALRDAVDALDSKHVVLPFDTTCENLCTYVARYLDDEGGETLRAHGVTSVRVQIWETETCYAQTERPLTGAAGAGVDASVVHKTEAQQA